MAIDALFVGRFRDGAPERPSRADQEAHSRPYPLDTGSRPPVPPAFRLGEYRLLSIRMVAWATGLGLVASALALTRVPNLVDVAGCFLAIYALAFVCYAAGSWAIERTGGAPRATLGLVLGVAVASRLALLPTVPTLSTDAYRYVWDARVARAGLSPFAYAPTAPEVSALRDHEIYPRLNHSTWRTIYPPGAQVFFRAVYALAPDSVRAMKVGVALAELAALGLMLLLVKQLGLPSSRVVVYAWNPLVLVEVWGSAHIDGLVLPAVVGATLAAVTRRPRSVAALLAAGALVKLYPVLLLPLLLGAALETRDGHVESGARRMVAARWGVPTAIFVAVVALGYAPLARLGRDALGSLPRYVSEEYFNPGLVRTLVNHSALALGAVLAWAAWATWWRDGASLAIHARRLAGGSTVLGPNVFPWYAAWVVPFLALAPSPSWIGFTGTVMLAYTFFLATPWAIPPWARAVEFAPVGLAALGWVWTRRMAKRARGARLSTTRDFTSS